MNEHFDTHRVHGHVPQVAQFVLETLLKVKAAIRGRLRILALILTVHGLSKQDSRLDYLYITSAGGVTCMIL